MNLTVRRTLEIDVWKKATVVAGEQGLDKEISFVNILEVPEVVQWMKGGELLLTAGYAFKDDPVLRKDLVYNLAKKQVAALAIKPGQHLSEIPEDMIRHANEVGLPLLELPKDLPYMEFMLPIFEILISTQLYKLRRAEETHNRLLEVVLDGGGFGQICQSLANLVSNPALILDKTGNRLNSYPELDLGGNCQWENLIQSWLEVMEDYLQLEPNRCHRREIWVGAVLQPLVLLPIGINEKLNGFLVVPECNRVLDEHDLRAIEYAGTIATLIFAKEKAVFDAERQIKGEFLEDLVSGDFQSEEVVIRRASFFNFNVKKPLAVFVFDIDSFEEYFINEARRDEKHIQSLKGQVLKFVYDAFSDYPGGAMLQMKSDGIMGLARQMNLGDEMKFKEKYWKINEQLKQKYPKISISAGVGRPYEGLRNIKESHTEAEIALRVGRFVNGGNSVNFFRDLGAYRLLYELKDSAMAHSFRDEILGGIRDYDIQKRTELYNTLVYYFKNDRNLRRTADEMFVHRNSVAYRLKKIEEISGINLSDPEACFSMQISLKLEQMLEGQSWKMRGT